MSPRRMERARLLLVGNVPVDVVMQVPAMPGVGQDVRAEGAQWRPGGGYAVLRAAHAGGLQVAFAGPHGVGPLGDLVRSALTELGCSVELPATPERDSGYVVTLVDASGERTLVSSPDAVLPWTPETLAGVQLQPRDVVYVSGYSLGLGEASAALASWTGDIPAQHLVCCDLGPWGSRAAASTLAPVLDRVDWLSVTDAEARSLAEAGEDASPAELCEQVRRRLARGGVVVRVGAAGCWVAERGEAARHVPVTEVEGVVDTTGAGDTHVGAFLAALATGATVVEAAERANAAAGDLLTSRRRMSPDPLREYRRKRDADVTPEPVPPEGSLPVGNDDTFVVQEHHARALHWDFRLERNGVLVSWAVPKGIPTDRRTNHLAVQTEDHPLEYASFGGDIPAGEYGGGHVMIWDRGTYETEEWTPDKVKVVLHGGRVTGRFVLFHTDGKNWMMHRMDDAAPGWEPLPELVPPMLATPSSSLPKDQGGWAYEMKWDGVRAIGYVDGGRLTLRSRNDRDVTATYPELRTLGESMGSTQAILDGEIVAFDDSGRPSFGRLQQRLGVTGAAQTRRLASSDPVVYIIFDVLHLDGRSTLGLPYAERRELLMSLELVGPSWQTPPGLEGDGADLLEATREQGLEGILAKREDSSYLPGRRSPNWLKIKNHLDQEVVIGGWRPGAGRRAGTLGALLLGIPDEDGLRYVGKVGTGFTDAMLHDLEAQLIALERPDSPFVTVPQKDTKGARWCAPELVGEVELSGWTGDGRLRHPSWRGLRPDRSPGD